MKMTEEEFEEHQELHSAYCSHCDAIMGENLEGDAEEEECPECGEDTLMGMDMAMSNCKIDLVEGVDEVDGAPDILNFNEDDF